MAKKSSINRQIKKKPAALKAQILDQTGGLLQDSQAVILTEYRGLTVPQMGDIRRKLREAGDNDFSVVKNTLFRRAAEVDGVIDPGLDAALNGTTAAVFAKGDPIAAAKALVDYIAANRNTPLAIKGGVVEGRFQSAADIDALARIPPRDVLIAMILGAFQSPLVNFAATLQAVADKKAAEA